jgi:hypothetical protein
MVKRGIWKEKQYVGMSTAWHMSWHGGIGGYDIHSAFGVIVENTGVS